MKYIEYINININIELYRTLCLTWKSINYKYNKQKSKNNALVYFREKNNHMKLIEVTDIVHLNWNLFYNFDYLIAMIFLIHGEVKNTFRFDIKMIFFVEIDLFLCDKYSIHNLS